MKNKFYKAILATTLCVALATPIFTMPVYAGNSSIIWEDEDPFVTAIWGKYSKFDGKLVYRLTNIEDTDIYTEDAEEVKTYGFEVVGEYVNERGETYYKFKYVGMQEVLPVPQTDGDTITIIPPVLVEPEDPENEIIYEPVVEPEDPKNEIVYETVVENWVATDYTIETVVEDTIVSDYTATETVSENWVATDYTIETVVEDVIVSDYAVTETASEELVASDYTITETVEDIVVSDYAVTETASEELIASDYTIVTEIVYEEPVFNALYDEQVAILSEEFFVTPDCGNDALEGTENCTVGHCSDAKEIIWEEVWTISEEPEEPTPIVTTFKVPNSDIVIPWHEELVHNPANNVNSTAGKEDIWEFVEPSADFLGCKTGACYQVQLSENFSFRTENVAWILECGFEISGEYTNKDGIVIYSFKYVK